jgi:protein-S-isoprenylcysteine O-methyltransferase Ste14
MYVYAAVVLMAGLHFLWPIKVLIRPPWIFAGLFLVAVGFAINIWADNLFKKRETTVKPFQKSAQLVTEGPFRISRHPMYLGMALGLLGLNVLLGSISPLFVVFLFVAAMERQFIRHEERAMTETFKEAYGRYKTRVRRWI